MDDFLSAGEHHPKVQEWFLNKREVVKAVDELIAEDENVECVRGWFDGNKFRTDKPLKKNTPLQITYPYIAPVLYDGRTFFQFVWDNVGIIVFFLVFGILFFLSMKDSSVREHQINSPELPAITPSTVPDEPIVTTVPDEGIEFTADGHGVIEDGDVYTHALVPAGVPEDLLITHYGPPGFHQGRTMANNRTLRTGLELAQEMADRYELPIVGICAVHRRTPWYDNIFNDPPTILLIEDHGMYIIQDRMGINDAGSVDIYEPGQDGRNLYCHRKSVYMYEVE